MRKGDEAPPVRVGLDVRLARAAASVVQWFGLGPHESYVDRHSSARLCVWSGRVSEQTTRYVRPQENGNKFGTRWMVLSDDSGSRGTIIVAAGPPLSLGCHHHLPEDFETVPESRTPQYRHAADVVERDLTALTIDGAQAGVGGIDSYGSLLHHQQRRAAPIMTVTMIITIFQVGLTTAAAASPLR